jgi:thiosulfate dehydrogenase
MFRALLVGILIGIVLVFVGVYFYFTTGTAPVAVTDPEMPFEAKLAHRALHARVAKQPPTESPVPVNDQNLLAGADIYKQHCAVCHGLPAEPETAIAHGMSPKPPELFHGTGVTDDPAWETHWKAENGIRMTGMPGFKGKLTDTELWQVSQLLANADKLPPSVKAALTVSPAGAKGAGPQTVAPGTK